jgi:hypothetical protein
VGQATWLLTSFLPQLRSLGDHRLRHITFHLTTKQAGPPHNTNITTTQEASKVAVAARYLCGDHLNLFSLGQHQQASVHEFLSKFLFQILHLNHPTIQLLLGQKAEQKT